jgi:hypothetical protein
VRVGFRTLFSLVLCAAAAGAALAHVAIDYAGDFLLPQDTYDHLAHGSRGLLSGVALVVAAVLAARGLRICCEIGAANRTRLLPTARLPYELAGFSLGAVVISCALVPAMELFDARLDGVALQQIGDAFGGSLLLGLVTTAACATLVALLVHAVVGWLISHRDTIATVIEALCRRTVGERPSRHDLGRQLATPRRRRTGHALCLTRRGPPETIFA